jgi:O-antigen/teichoic acid export membrane protein
MPPMTAPVPTNEGLIRRLLAGYGIQGVNVTVMLLLQLLVIPIFLSYWGQQVYGDWLTLSAAAGFMALADLGFGGALANHLRASWSRGDGVAFRRTIRMGLSVHAGLAVLAAVAVLILATGLDLPTRLGVANQTDATAIFILLCFTNLLTTPRWLFTTIYSARGEFGREGSLNLLYYGGQILVQGTSVVLGATPVETAVACLATSLLLGWTPLLVDLMRHHSDVPLRPQRPTLAELKDLTAKAPYYLVPAVALSLQLQMPVVLLGMFAGSAAAVVFTTMRTFTGLTRQVTTQLFIVTSMEMARQHDQQDKGGLLHLYAQSGRLIAGMTGLLAGLSLVLGPTFFALWTRGTIVFDPALASVFLGTILVLGPTFGCVWLLRHTDHPETVAAGFALQTVLGITLCLLLLAAGLGPVGAALGVGVAELVAPGLQSMVVVGRLLRVQMLVVALPIYGTTVLALALGAGAALEAVRLAPGSGIVGLGVAAGLWAVLVAVPAFALLLDARQRTRFRRRLMGLIAALRRREPP